MPQKCTASPHEHASVGVLAAMISSRVGSTSIRKLYIVLLMVFDLESISGTPRITVKIGPTASPVELPVNRLLLLSFLCHCNH